MSGGYECKKCRKVVEAKWQYFFRCTFADCHDSIEIGFSRDVAASLMGITAEEFRQRFTSSKQVEDYVAAEVLFRNVRLTVKKKEETFQGETRQRYYAFAAKYVTDQEMKEEFN